MSAADEYMVTHPVTDRQPMYKDVTIIYKHVERVRLTSIQSYGPYTWKVINYTTVVIIIYVIRASIVNALNHTHEWWLIKLHWLYISSVLDKIFQCSRPYTWTMSMYWIVVALRTRGRSWGHLYQGRALDQRNTHQVTDNIICQPKRKGKNGAWIDNHPGRHTRVVGTYASSKHA